MDELYSIEEIEAWIDENPGGNDWLVAILRDGERGIARSACDRAVAEAEAQDSESANPGICGGSPHDAALAQQQEGER